MHLLKKGVGELALVSAGSILLMILFASLAVFQILLVFGYPLGEFALGGYHKTLPFNLRLLSAFNALVLIVMGIVFLQYTDVLKEVRFLPQPASAWVVTLLLGLNTIANMASRSPKERKVMTPVAGFAFILCLAIIMSPK